MKVEEDLKEIKNNFFRVMHCAFAKYEEGFKRKNEYLERRRAKKRLEIETGVQKELEQRKIQALATLAVAQATPEGSSEEDFEVDPENAKIDERKFLRTMARQDMHDQDDLADKQEKEKSIKKDKSYQTKKKVFLQRVMNNEIDIRTLTKKRKKKEKKKKRGYSDFIKTGKVRAKYRRQPGAPAPVVGRKRFNEDKEAEAEKVSSDSSSSSSSSSSSDEEPRQPVDPNDSDI